MYVHFAGSCAQFPIFRSEKKSVIEFIVIVVAGCWQVFEYQWMYTIFVEETLKKEERKNVWITGWLVQRATQIVSNAPVD